MAVYILVHLPVTAAFAGQDQADGSDGKEVTVAVHLCHCCTAVAQPHIITMR